MSENKDSAIKLFGKTIQLGSNLNGDVSIAKRIESSADAARAHVDCDSTSCDHNLFHFKQSKNRGYEKSSSLPSEVSKLPTGPLTNDENSKTPSNYDYCSSQDSSQSEDQSDQTSSALFQDQNPPKKPDKILSCPRCSSMETKFCYFNNYNVNQPRHFCKNCHRYWTAGGTLRNVPVGAGRRKSKNPIAFCPRNLLIRNASTGLVSHSMRPSGDPPPAESIASTPMYMSNGFIRQEGIPTLYHSSGNGKEMLNSMLIPNTISISKGANRGERTSGIPSVLPSFPSFYWPCGKSQIAWQSGFPVSFYSAGTHFTGNSPGTYDLQWPSSCPVEPSTSSSPTSPALGKHVRDETMLISFSADNTEPAGEKKSENGQIVVPKALKIDTLGTNNKKLGSSDIGRGFFEGLNNSQDNNHDHYWNNPNAQELSILLQTNPAAISRSVSFHEIAQFGC